MKTKKCKKFNPKKTYKLDKKVLHQQIDKLKYLIDRSLVKKISKEFNSRTKHEYKTITVPLNKYKYFYEIKKKEIYGTHYIIDCNNKSHKMLNLNEMSKGYKFFNLGNFSLNYIENSICYTIDTVGDRNYSLYYRELLGNKPIKVLSNVAPDCIWHPYSYDIYYITYDNDLRPNKVYKYNISTNKHTLIYHEKDTSYQLTLSSTSNGEYNYIIANSRKNVDIIIITSCGINDPFKRKHHHFYSIGRRNNLWYVLEKNDGKSKIQTSRDLKKFDTLIDFKDKHNVRYFLLKQNYMLFSTRDKGELFLYIYDFRNEKTTRISFMDYRCHYFLPYMHNYNFKSDVLYAKVGSFTVPNSLVKIDLINKQYKILNKTTFKSYNEKNYHEKLVYVNKDLAITILYKKVLKKESKCLLYGYGSYGVVLESEYSKHIPSLLDRGFIYCFAHVRGSKFNGYSWYKDGKILNKKNTFIDFISCAKYLLDNKYTVTSKLAIWGRSAGGLLIGSVINTEPELFHLAILGVPFLDVSETMHNPCQPLTTEEYHEWGNPKNKKIDAYQRSYSPIDNINLSNNYPNIYIYSNVEDTLVPYKSVLNYYHKIKQAKVFKSGQKQLLLNIDNKYGHNQSSNRYEAMHEMAKIFALIIHFIP